MCLALLSLPTVHGKTFLEVHSESERQGLGGAKAEVHGFLRIHGWATEALNPPN